MVHHRVAAPLPPAYRGKEPSYIKHELLKAYLKRLFVIIGMSAQRLGISELCYVDAFSGPWLDESDELGSTSIAISLGILEECRLELEKQSRPLQIRALYVEKDKAAFARLERYLSEHAPAKIEVKAIPGDFVALQQTILEWCRTDAFAFFFLDPKGWIPVGVKVLQPLLARPRSEFLITFMYDFVARFASKQQLETHMLDFLGEAPNVGTLHGPAREKHLLNIYRRNLKQSLPSKTRWPARSAYVRVLDREKDRAKYHLVYLTSHPHGITVFMEISEALDPVQKLVRASTKQTSRIQKTGQSELWIAEDMADADDQAVDIVDVEEFWLACLSVEPTIFREAEFADLLEKTNWFPGDLQRALGNLIGSGKVRNLDAEGKRRIRFLHFEKKNGERLQLTGSGK